MTYQALSPGMNIEDSTVVTEDDLALHLGSGALKVYATPAMVRFIELTCRKLIEPKLPASQSTVGVDIHVKHLAPTPLGGKVRVRAEIIEIEGNLIRFQAEVWDTEEKIGEAEHQRAVIDIARFQKRVAQKSAAN